MDDKKQAVNKKSAKKKKRGRMTRVEKQTAILLFILVSVLFAFVTAKLVFMPLLKKPYFDYEGYRVYRVNLEGTDIIFYSIPTTFIIYGTTQKQTNVVLRHDPRDLKAMNISTDLKSYFLKTRPKTIWITMKPDLIGEKMVNPVLEISKFTQGIDIETITAATYAVENKTAKIMTCENATDEDRVIMLDLGNETKIESVSQDCVLITADSYDNLLKVSDWFVMSWLVEMTK